MSEIENRLKEMGISLPEPVAPLASYVPFTIANGMMYISGQISMRNGDIIKGRLGDDMSVEAGQEAAHACGLMLLAQAKLGCDGDLSRLDRCIRLGGFITCTPEFTDQPKVINAASDMMMAAMGEAGRHARAAVGVPSLPLGAAVEIEATFSLK